MKSFEEVAKRIVDAHFSARGIVREWQPLTYMLMAEEVERMLRADETIYLDLAEAQDLRDTINDMMMGPVDEQG